VRKKGRVISLAQGRATVCFESAAACEKCEVAQFCRAAGSEHTAVVENDVRAQINDVVYVEQAPGKALLSGFVLFGLPVVLAVLGLAFGTRSGEKWSVVLGISGFVLGLLIAKIIDIVVVRKALLLPRITEIVK
jgi:positive regulator of sigma E activity